MKCFLCPNECGVNREKEVGFCGERGLRIAGYGLHRFEEPPVSFRGGSGTVFFIGCALKCVFCQNYDLSRSKTGREITPKELADVFKKIEDSGAENVNLVNPSHFILPLLEAFSHYKPQIPVVYNTHSYERLEALKAIDPFVDIYLPDLKFCSPALSERYTGKADYFEVAKKAVAFMAQKPAAVREDGKMLGGIIVRHLVLPLAVSDSKAVLSYLKEILPEEARVSVMAQYTPFGEIENFPELQRKITAREYRAVCDHLDELNFPHLFLQERSSASERFIPDWEGLKF